MHCFYRIVQSDSTRSKNKVFFLIPTCAMYYTSRKGSNLDFLRSPLRSLMSPEQREFYLKKFPNGNTGEKLIPKWEH